MEIFVEPDRSLANVWHFRPDAEMPGGHCSRVYASRDRVLKVPFMGEEKTSGHVAAQLLSGNLGPRVFNSDDESGAVLMERLDPGSNLAESALSEDQQLDVFLDLALRLRDLDVAIDEEYLKMSVPDRALHNLCSTSKGLLPLDEFVTNPTCPLIPDLLGTSPKPVFLHGDLHHFNILFHRSRWLAIDPKGLIGDPAFEAAAFVRNPIPQIGDWPDLVNFLSHRINRLAEGLNVAPNRIWGWAMAELWDNDESGDEPWDKVKAALLKAPFSL